MKNHQTSLVKSWTHITCDGKLQDIFLPAILVFGFFLIHSSFLSCCFVVKVTQQYSIHIWERTFMSYARCCWTVLTCNLYMMAKKERQKCNQIFKHLKWLTEKRTRKVEIKKGQTKYEQLEIHTSCSDSDFLSSIKLVNCIKTILRMDTNFDLCVIHRSNNAVK